MFFVDLHTHTSDGSPCGYMSPTELVRRAKAMGLDGVCITDHDQVWDRGFIQKLRVENDFPVIGGVEVSTDCGEILVFGLHEPVLKIFDAGELRETVKRAGGIMVAAHPLRGEFTLSNPQGPQNAPETLPIFQFVDAVETHNGLSGLRETEMALRTANCLKLPETGGSDAHAILAVGSCYTIFEQRIDTEEDLIREIRLGRCKGARWNPTFPNR